MLQTKMRVSPRDKQDPSAPQFTKGKGMGNFFKKIFNEYTSLVPNWVPIIILFIERGDWLSP